MNPDRRITLVTGGARSGKSALAETLAGRAGGPLVYVATAEARDPEMARRIASHRDRRGPSWQTVEEALDLPGVLARTQGVRLVDCLTLWLSNVMAAGDPEPAVAGCARPWRGPRTPSFWSRMSLARASCPKMRLPVASATRMA
ncbi:bifunctional adenosylcobinamide kinase/adenosylcobinamide-phosphate guanylyltransferase [Paracoccus mutanolyticus]|uniref:bifunctional adenosylcobinamide kinase/adenosylcobinamide-phosphate guanylyltransferase n=1 Tax=Paracoccus mutanolyticus TaxID=1499308 RepID=UPI0037C71BFD